MPAVQRAGGQGTIAMNALAFILPDDLGPLEVEAATLICAARLVRYLADLVTMVRADTIRPGGK
jgi:hypothetical protein